MSDAEPGFVGALVGFLILMLLRLLDYLLPKGRHFRWIDRFTIDDDNELEE